MRDEIESAIGPGIRATREELEEVRDGRSVVRLRRADVLSVALRRGPIAERPVLELVMGVALFAPGAWWMRGAFVAVTGGVTGNLVGYVVTAGIMMLALGGMLILRAVRVGEVVVVELGDGGRRKLSFDGPLSAHERERFATQLRGLGWTVTSSGG